MAPSATPHIFSSDAEIRSVPLLNEISCDTKFAGRSAYFKPVMSNVKIVVAEP